MPVLLLLAGAVILVGVVGVATGRGGEMAEFPSDYLPSTLDDLVTAADVAALRPPTALWGYNTQVTDEALSRIAHVVTERDVEIAVLRQQLADLRAAAGVPVTAAVRQPAVLARSAPRAAGRGTGQHGEKPGTEAAAAEPGAGTVTEAVVEPAAETGPGTGTAAGPGTEVAAEPGAEAATGLDAGPGTGAATEPGADATAQASIVPGAARGDE